MSLSKKEIVAWLKSVNIYEYKINSDYTVDVQQTVNLSGKKLTSIPIKFGTIDGNFLAENNLLTSLKGSPRIVKGDFNVKGNLLKTLKFCPKEIDGFFIIARNEVKNFTYAPEKVLEDIICIKNPLDSLMELKTVFGGTLQHYKTLEDHTSEQIRYFEEFYSEDNILTVTYEEVKAVQMHTALSSQLSDKQVLKKSHKI